MDIERERYSELELAFDINIHTEDNMKIAAYLHFTFKAPPPTRHYDLLTEGNINTALRVTLHF